MSVLNRAMFRIPGQDQISGIMRSSPELIRVSTANASPLNKSFQVPKMNMNMVPGVASDAKSQSGKFIFPQVIASSEDVDPTRGGNQKEVLDQLKELSKTELEAKKKEQEDRGETFAKKINKSNQDIFDKDAENFGGGDIPVSEAPLTSNVVKKDGTDTTTTTKDFDTVTDADNIQIETDADAILDFSDGDPFSEGGTF